jgi:hypothetical protein
LKDLANEHREITDSYSKTQSGLVKEVVNIACENVSMLLVLTLMHYRLLSDLYSRFRVPE